MHAYISLGMQCITSEFLNHFSLKKETLPFDWILTPIEFVYKILKMILNDKVSIDTITDEFFNIDGRVVLKNSEYFVTDPLGGYLFNSKNNVVFPHDSPNDREKYKRRLARLRDLLKEDLCFHFVYISQSSDTEGKYNIDGKDIVKDLYMYLLLIKGMFDKKLKKFNITVFDTNLVEDVSFGGGTSGTPGASGEMMCIKCEKHSNLGPLRNYVETVVKNEVRIQEFLHSNAKKE